MGRWEALLAATVGGLLAGSDALAQATTVQSLSDFTQLALQGVNLDNPTTVNVGADGRLYVSQQNGLIAVLTVLRQTSTVGSVQTETWTVTDRYDIASVRTMPNHDDQGRYLANVGDRQITGAVTTVDAGGNVMLYVTSSDPGGAVGTDTNLDTNSGVISRLTQRVDAGGNVVLDGNGDPVWDKLDLVRGFPRSEENHTINGLELVTRADGTQALLVAVGGHTNAGAQGNNFAYTPEYFYSGSIVLVDLDALLMLEASPGPQLYVPSPGSVHPYLFDLPTLDDPTRTNGPNGGDLDGDGVATADVFGGNDGLNQAIFDPSGVVELYGVGYRNPYDVTVTASGDVYTADNGPNGGWGGVVLNASGQPLVDANSDGVADNGPGVNLSNESGSVNKGDQLHYVGTGFTAPAYDQAEYGGHPNLYRARGAAAGFYLYAANNNPYGVASGTPLDVVNGTVVASAIPVDLAPLVSNASALTGTNAQGQPNVDPRQEVFRAPARQTGILGGPDGSLYSFSSSTNGIDEYPVPGGLHNALLTVSFNGDITALLLDANGDVASSQHRALTSSPLDVVAQDVTDPYPGVIFVAAYGADQIVILSPDQGQGVVPNPNDRDLDGIDDTFDPFAVDPFNGYVDLVRSGDTYVWDFVLGPNSAPPNDNPAWFDGTGGLYAGGSIGFTGLMTNRQGLPETLVDPNNVIYGGAPGILQVKAVEEGTPAANTQRNGFQLGVNPVSTVTSFEVSTHIDNFLDEIGNLPAAAEARQGLFVGAGDQDNYVAVQLTKRSNGDVGFEVESQFAFAFVGATPVQVDWYPVPALASPGAQDTVTLGLDVNRSTGMVTPEWTYTTANGTVTASGNGVDVGLTGDAWDALQGVLMLPTDSGTNIPSGFAVGLLSSLAGAGNQTFQADFDDLAISGFGAGAGPLVTAINAGGTQYTAVDGTVFAEDLFNNGNTATTTASIAGTADDALFQSERWNPGGFTYEIPVQNGSYLVQMYFAETYGPNFSAGARVFDVLLEGSLVFDDLDVFAEAGGGDTALVKSDLVSVADGSLTLTTTPESQNPQINGFAIYEFTLDTLAPTISVTYDPPVIFDDVLEVTVTYADDQQLDATSIDLPDVTFAGTGNPLEILQETLTVSGSGGQAYAVYEIRPVGGWVDDTITVSVPGGAIQDAAGNPNAAFSNSAYTFVGSPNPAVIAVNCGDQGAYTSSTGLLYQADTFQNGQDFSVGRPIAGTSDTPLYQSERFSDQATNGPLVYEFPVPNGTYLMELEYAEISNQITGSGQRLMDVFVEGQLVFDDLDIFDEAGGIDIAITKRVVVEVTDGLLRYEAVGIVQNPKLNAFAVFDVDPADANSLSAFLNPANAPLIDTTDAVGGTGDVLVEVLDGANNVQTSNFGNNSWTIDNLGTKRIAAVYLDVAPALFGDSVFDDDGTGGDQVTKPLTFSLGASATLPVNPAVTPYDHLAQPARGSSFAPLAAFVPGQLGNVDNLFVDAVSNNNLPSPKAGGGFRGQLLIFDDFGAGETVGFASDMDPNSIAGLTKNSVDSSSNPVGVGSNFDIGGVSGAELVGSVITVLFGDGTVGRAELGHDGSQAGAHARIVTGGSAVPPTAEVSVDGFLPGDAGTYGIDRPVVVVTGTPGDTVRVSMVKALDPVGNTATVAGGAISIDALVAARLQAQYPDFPVNNAVEWQHVDVVVPASGSVDITYGVGNQSFDYVNIANSIAGADDFPGDDVLPIAFVAAVIDSQGVPLGPVSAPITLLNQGGPAICEDRDGDGATTCTNDCDDLDPTVFPGQLEVCDGIDNDCDGTVDGPSADDAITYFADVDGDTYGDPGSPLNACSPPPGYVLDDSDCDDVVPTINPGESEVCDGLDNDCDGTVDGPSSTDALTFYADTDGDGFGDPNAPAFDCSAPAGYVADDTDCDDTTAAVNPGNPELCNGFDDNCDGLVDDSSSSNATQYFEDADGDSYGNASSSQFACSQPANYVLDDTDCDDQAPGVNPGAAEVCDGIDNDCDAVTDPPTSANAPTWYADVDSDGYGDAASSQPACNQPPGYVADATDCDDTRAIVFPGAPEVCDALDNDCDGTVDGPGALDAATWYADGDGDTFGDPDTTQLECVQPSGYVDNALDCDDGSATVNPDADEVCGDGIDNDCDTLVDDPSATDAATWYRDADGDSYGDPGVPQLACTQPPGFVADDTDCDDASNVVSPAGDEVCGDGVDNDCDMLVDDPSAVDAATWFADADNDGFGDETVTEVACTPPPGFVALSTDCDDGAPAVNPSVDEACGDGIDNDCDTLIDDSTAFDARPWYADSDGDTYGDADVSEVACTAPVGFVADATDCDDQDSQVNPAADEECDDGIDNDCDTRIDDPTASDARTWYADRDDDTFGNRDVTEVACTRPEGFVAMADDCDDQSPAVNPAADEECDGIDNDCDTRIDDPTAVDARVWHEDADGDDYGNASVTVVACTQPTGFVLDETDCDDQRTAVNPGMPERCGNGLDDDCDGGVDVDASDAPTWYRDADGDDYGDPGLTVRECARPAGFVDNDLDCDDAAAMVNPGVAEVCNAIDDDCDGTTDLNVASAPTWYRDRDADGFGDDASTVRQCDAPAGYAGVGGDCDDAAELVNPGQAEVCDEADVDENCNGEAEEPGAVGESTFYVDDDGDGYGGQSILACDRIDGLVSEPGDCNDADDVVFPGAPEDCSDRRDTNCDGRSGNDDNDGDGAAFCDDCDDADPDRYPDADEICDGIDNDCDEGIDVDATDAPSWYVDADGDGYGDEAVVDCNQPDGTVAVDGDCDDNDVDISPASSEIPNDGIDQDCDGFDDEGCGGCASGGSSSSAWIALLGLGVLLRRRRS